MLCGKGGYCVLVGDLRFMIFFCSQSWLPMQLQNAIASLDAPLQYSPNVVIGPQFPRTKQCLPKLHGKHVTDSLSLDLMFMASYSCQCRSHFPGSWAPCSASQCLSHCTSATNHQFPWLCHEGMTLKTETSGLIAD